MKYPELSRGFRTFIRLEWTFTGLEWILLEIHRAVTKRGKFTGLEWILLEIHRAGMDFNTGDSPGWNGIYWRITGLFRNEESSPGWNGFYGRFTGLEWIFLEIHRAGMTFTGNTLADMNLPAFGVYVIAYISA